MLAVQEGGFGVAATNALAGLDVTFAPDTAFVVAAEQSDAGVRAKGAVLTDTNITAPDGINVRFDGISSTLESGVNVAIATVAVADADDFAAKLKINRVPHCWVRTSRIVNGDGSVTFMARIVPAGFCISFN